MRTATLAALEAAAPGRVRRDAPLARLSRWRIGGTADALVEPASPRAAAATVRALEDAATPWIVIGDGSNLLFDSAGFQGVALRIGPSLAGLRIDAAQGIVESGAGLWVPCFVRRTIRAGLGGCVHAIGIPGTIGGLVVMNGGSLRQGIGDHLIDVTLIDREGGLRTLDRAACAFGYRASALQGCGGVVISARFRYEPADPAALRREATAILAARRRRFPREWPNCGSVFVSDPALYATLGPPGQAIEAVGLKGFRIGGARFSPRHANVIENVGGATSEDVLRLVTLARRRVGAATGIWMRSEVLHLPPEGPLRPAHLSPLEP